MNTRGDRKTSGGNEFSADQPSWALTSKARNNNQKNAAVRDASEPAGTLYFAHALNDVRWVHERPATTIVSSFGQGTVAPPGHHTTSTYEAEESVAITVEEASILQSFRPDYPWQGSKTKKFEQIGNAIPPVLAAAILSALIGERASEEVA